MRWEDISMPLLDRPLESQLHLSQKDAKVLSKACAVLESMKKHLEEEWGEDDAYDVPEAQPWIMAACYLGEALEDLNVRYTGRKPYAFIKFPPREDKEK